MHAFRQTSIELASIVLPIIGLLGLSSTATATTSLDAEPNNTFATAQVIPTGDFTISGDLSIGLSTAFGAQSGTLAPGSVISHDFVAPAGMDFTAVIDNSASGTDTTLGVLDAGFNLIATDDDSSPLGSGLASSLNLTTNPDGTVHLLVSGFNDFDFDGLADGTTQPHTQTGDYDIFLFEGSITGDVDIYAFTGLTPGQEFIAETSPGSTGTSPDTVLGWFDNLGGIIATDDDDGVGLFSQLSVTVAADGNLFVGVSAFADFNFDGDHTGSGSYTLDLTPVPEPGSLSLSIFGLLCGLKLLRRRR